MLASKAGAGCDYGRFLAKKGRKTFCRAPEFAFRAGRIPNGAAFFWNTFQVGFEIAIERRVIFVFLQSQTALGSQILTKLEWCRFFSTGFFRKWEISKKKSLSSVCREQVEFHDM